MFIGRQGTFVIANREDLARVSGPVIEALRTKDYERGESWNLKLQPLPKARS